MFSFTVRINTLSNPNKFQVKQLFSRDSHKKSKKEKEVQKERTRVLKSPEHLAEDEPGYRRYRDPEPSDDERRRQGYRDTVER